jgi:hypothetical protein
MAAGELAARIQNERTRAVKRAGERIAISFRRGIDAKATGSDRLGYAEQPLDQRCASR